MKTVLLTLLFSTLFLAAQAQTQPKDEPVSSEPKIEVNYSQTDPQPERGVRISCGSPMNQNTDPLYVVDGKPMEKSFVLSSLDPETIESISILKNIESIAVYGERGANGVMVITTKDAKTEEN
jgi:TonB-dependent SusC/RagA subfamily outer membrane receptor